jgi:glycogenin glucosyltransferase
MSKYAWCSLVMIGDTYAPGAMVMAHSLRQVNTKHPILCMVTYDVSKAARDALAQCFDKVIEVPYITHAVIPMRSHKQRDIYGAWITKSFTKWNVLDPELFQYDKIIFCDADMFVVQNIDHLFDIAGPAGTFSSPWAKPYVPDGFYNPYIKDGAELAHNVVVPTDMIMNGLNSPNMLGFVWHASLVLVMPNKLIWAQYKKILSSRQPYGWKNCASGFDEQILSDLYLQCGVDMYNIHQIYNWLIGKPDWIKEPPHVYQYYNKVSEKPWNLNRGEWDDLVEWWKLADDLVRQTPGLKSYFIEPPLRK